MVTVLVDVENVRRSLWPNVASERLVELLGRWAEAEGVEAVAIFDGEPPPAAAGPAVRLAGSRDESADDRIAAEAAGLAARGERVWVVTSDRGLRARVDGAAERTIGGGGFVRLLTDVERA